MRKSIVVFLILALSVAVGFAGWNDPIEGPEFERMVQAQNLKCQEKLAAIFPESAGYQITGPLYNVQFSSVRVICPDLQSYDSALLIAKNNPQIEYRYDTSFLSSDLIPHQNTLHTTEYYLLSDDGKRDEFMLTTIQAVRFRIWAGGPTNIDLLSHDNGEEYYFEAAEYFARIDSGLVHWEPPKAKDYGLPASYGIYAPAPPYVIEGYQNYKDYLYSHREIDLDFISGVLAFVPSAETFDWFKNTAPEAAFPNKEQPRLQEEYREFFERGGDLQIIQTLTPEGYDTLANGEYFFALGINGKIRFGRELLREEVDRIEKESGKKVPRANHAFLFPGEPVLTAGAFWIDTLERPKLTAVSAQSGHYFYSNIMPTIREDIARKSDYYLTTLGHFFDALDSLGIVYDSVLVRKF